MLLDVSQFPFIPGLNQSSRVLTLRTSLCSLSLMCRAQDFVQNDEQLQSKWTKTKELNKSPLPFDCDETVYPTNRPGSKVSTVGNAWESFHALCVKATLYLEETQG